MESRPLAIADVVLMEPRAFADERGLFFESFNAAAFAEATGVSRLFVQDNHSVSRRGVVRGLHYQLPPFAQGKLVRVVAGAVFDVAVDVRRGSPTFGRWVGEMLSAENRRQLWIPEGFAHGFMALEDETQFLYKTTAPYNRDSERAIMWNDPAIAIDWPRNFDPIVSERDMRAPVLANAREMF
jgi:dTDP-4-dehydrorhamnose 3,5-epimerase